MAMNNDLIKQLRISTAAVDFFAKQQQSLSQLAHLSPIIQNSLENKAFADLIGRDLGISNLIKSLPQIPSLPASMSAGLEASKALEYFRSQEESTRLAAKLFERTSDFTLPSMAYARSQFHDFSSLNPNLFQQSSYGLVDLVSLEKTFGAMLSPWLNVNDVARSLSGVVEIHQLARTLSIMPAFDHATSDLIRQGLGDWRDPITAPDVVFEQHTDRAAFYDQQGFERALTDFPPAAFDEMADQTGLSTETTALFALFDSPDFFALDAEEDRRAVVAYKCLRGFEIVLRRFIHGAMEKQFGANWPKQKLPPETYGRWVDKRSKVESAQSEPQPLIDYADFSDYHMIIQRTDNWNQVFKALFNRKEDILESLQRLNPIRIASMHARSVGNDDLLLLYVETKRVLSVTTAYWSRIG